MRSVFRNGPRRADQPLARLMLDSLDDAVRGNRPASAYPGIDPQALSAAAFMHKVAPAVYLHLRHDENAPAVLIAAMRERYQLQVARQLLIATDLAFVAAALGDLGVPWAAFKGPVLAERLWSRPDLRQYVDLDVLVDRGRFGAVLDALLAAGAEMVDVNWTLIAEQTRAEVSLKLPNGTPLDLHWHVVNSRRSAASSSSRSPRCSSGPSRPRLAERSCRCSTRPTRSCTWATTPPIQADTG